MRAEPIVRWGLPLVAFAFCVATSPGYGIFRDELYYLACARHLDWGYVDHPPMVAVVAGLAHALFGTSVVGLRLFPSLAMGVTVWLVGETCRVMGSGRWGRVLAQLLALAAPVLLAVFAVLSMNAFDVLVWAALGWLAARLMAGSDPRLWLGFGLVAGLGLETKLDVGLFGACLVGGLVLARRWDVARSPWPWAGAGLAVVLFLPHVLWQAAHGWPTSEFVANAQQNKITVLGPLGFLASQPEMVGPAGSLAAVLGLGWLLAAPAARPFRALGWAMTGVIAVFALSISKPYYLAPGYTVLFPAAGVALDQWTAGRTPLRTAAARAALTIAASVILVAAPLARPILSEDAYVRYADALGVAPSTDEKKELGRLPQSFADQLGWPALAETVGGAYAALPEEDRARACVLAENYGEAGAIDLYGPAWGLPPAISGHVSYWLWGPRDCTGEVLIVLGASREELAPFFATVTLGAVHDCEDCMPYEDGLEIQVARGLGMPMADFWPKLKNYQ